LLTKKAVITVTILVLRFMPSDKPSKTKDVTNFLGETDAQTLCAGSKLGAFEIFDSRLSP